ncbi:MAG: hypothetical protein N3G75_07950 [Methanothrix sp.]|nr:hypothetical protein [Methanothrix sp.]MCX8207747.1 hypothetical protein [Methanothrix sp.]
MNSRKLVVGLVLCLFFVSSAGGAGLAFKQIPLRSDVLAVGNDAGVVNYYTSAFELPNLATNTPAILMLMTQNVDDAYSFITINIPPNDIRIINNAHYNDARTSRYFAGKLLETGDAWATQIVPIQAGLLRTTGNTLGIHTRTDSGGAGGNTDDIKVTRIYLLYYTT